MASSSSAEAARAHVERIRRERFYIGRGERNPLAEDIHQAVGYLSEELYSKDVHFLMELIQNAEDNDYPLDVSPALEFVITEKDITATGARSTLVVFNNERGFSAANIDSICRIGRSTKKGNKHLGYIGEKGIGFKSVFLVSSQPHIFSNGYQIKFNEKPSADCDIGYIVPEWVDGKPNIDDIRTVYGPSRSLPTTVIILPLKTDKILAVKKELSSTHPEILLFLSKIRQLSVREMNHDPKASKISQISISSEVDYRSRKDIDAESYTLHLAMQENSKGETEECTYYMWKQKFAVQPDCRIQKRMEVDQWVVTLAFPHGQRLSRGAKSPGVYAFLPTEMVTNLPFIIQADFLLASSRESILFDSKWNHGILECVPSAFVNAFGALLKSSGDAPHFALAPIFRFLPIQDPSISLFDNVRLSIKTKVEAEDIMPCESCTTQKVFCKPTEVSRLDSAFWRILNLAQKQGIGLQNLSLYGTFVLSSYLDNQEYDDVLKFLGIGYANKEWYSKCIDGLNLVKEASEELYLQILYFVAGNWKLFFGTSMMLISLIKYVDTNGRLSYSSVLAAQKSLKICTASNLDDLSWLISWNKELSAAPGLFFLPLSTHRSLDAFSGGIQIMDWLRNIVNMQILTPNEYASTASKSLNESGLALIYCHFLYHSHAKKYITESIIVNLCQALPVVDNFGKVIKHRKTLLVPADGSKWVRVIGTNPWRSQDYVELSADYSFSGRYAGNYTSDGQLIKFLRTYAQAADIPFLRPPNSSFPTVSSPLAMENALLLLQWIRNLKLKIVHLPQNFLNCIRNGKWLKTSHGYESPLRTFLASAVWGSKLQVQFIFADVPIIDEEFYGNRINAYKEELMVIGVQFEFANASIHIGNQPLCTEDAILLLQWIRHLRSRGILLSKNFLGNIKNGKWLKTSIGYNAPSQSFLLSSEWTNLRQIISELADVPLIDQEFYGNKISSYKEELRSIGVQFEFSYASVDMASEPLTMENAILLLQCIRNLRLRCVQLPQKFLSFISNRKWLKTSLGYSSPLGSFLLSAEWEKFPQIQSILADVHIIDQDFYGNEIKNYKEELRVIGVQFEFVDAAVHICNHLLSSTTKTFSRANMLALLQSIRFLNENNKTPHLIERMENGCWVKTCLGSRSPLNSILFNSEWENASVISILPFIDTVFYGVDIADFRSELELFGVVVGFKRNYQLVVDNFRFSKDTITPSATILMLKCIRYAEECLDFVERLKDLRWLKTDVGFRAPHETFLIDDDWKCLLEVVDKVLLLDLEFYGDEIKLYKVELCKTGLIAGFKEASKKLVCGIKKLVNTSSITKERAFALLECYRDLITRHGRLPVDLGNLMHRERWLHTSFGFRSPKEAILFGSEWESIALVSRLPFVDDSNTQYGLGKEIYCYSNELMALGAKAQLEQGAAFVISGLHIPTDPSAVTPEAFISLLKCIRIWRKNGSALPKSFMSAINLKWVKTTAGYRHPNSCILFGSACSSHVHRDDGPFVDEVFYGQELVSYESELQTIGVIVDPRTSCACVLLARHLKGLSNADAISRIYSYLEVYRWKPRYTSEDWIWIPHEANEGQWVNPDSCVLYDSNGLFDSQHHVLVKWYSSKLLGYFNTAFGVKHHPTVSDYCKLWSMWQGSNSALTQKECVAFWEFFGKNWSTDMGKFIAGFIDKVPVSSDDQILLLEKQDVFIPDDLLLEDLFKKQAQKPLFIWYPSTSLPCLSPARLNDIYSSIGVQKISKAVTSNQFELLKIESVTLVHKSTMIKLGLLKIVLAFLADPILNISVEKRHEMVASLTNVAVYETRDPLNVSYQVALSSGRRVHGTCARFFRWERENSRLFVTETDEPGSMTNARKMEYALCFAEEISKGLLSENTDQITALAELVRTGFLLEFDVPAVQILLNLKNLRLFEQDEEFLLPFTILC